MRKASVVCILVAAVWTLLLFIGAITVPVYSGSSSTATSGGSWSTTSTASPLLQENGAWVLVLLSVPAAAVLLTGGLLAIEPRHRWAGWAAWGPVGLVGILSLLGMFTIGIFLLPVVVLLGVAVLIVTLDRATTASQPSGSGLPPTASRR